LDDHPIPSAAVFSGGGFHLYWFLEESYLIKDDETREEIRRIQANWVDYTGSDKQSKDIARVLRVPGTTNYKDCYAPDYPKVEIVDFSQKEYSLNFLKKLSEPIPQPSLPPLPPPSRSGTKKDKEKYANQALTTAVNMVRESIDGEKHITLLKAAKLLGGYVAGGIIDESKAITALESEISQKPNVANLKTAFNTIRDGIGYGRVAPITVDQKISEEEYYWRQERDKVLYFSDALDNPEWMTVVASGKESAQALQKHGFCAVGLNGGNKNGITRFFKKCPRVFVAISQKQRSDLKELAQKLSVSGIETSISYLPAEPEEFFDKYGGDSRSMFKFMRLGKVLK